MKTRGSLRSIAFVLALLTAFYALPMAAFATGTDTAEGAGVSAGNASGNAAGGAATADASETVTSREAVYVGELADLREANGKHFLYSDGTVRYALYEQDVHYLDAEGAWQDIDNTLSPALTEDGGSAPRGLFSIPEYRYEVVNGDTSYSFAPRSSDAELLCLSFGAYGASFALLGAEDSVAVLGEEAEPSDDPAVLPALRSSITYGDVLADTDLTYILVGTSLYEHITVKAKGEGPYAYTFRLETEGLVPTLTEDGAVTLSAPSGEAVYTVPPSYMVDAAGEGSTAVAYTLTQISDSVWHLTITADSAWMNDPSRVYPVVIDPPVEIAGTARTLDTYISSADAGNASAEGYAGLSYAYAGVGIRTYQAFWKPLSLMGVPSDSVIVDATLTMHATAPSGGGAVLGIYPVENNWNAALVWDAVEGASPTVGVADVPEDYVIVSGGTTNGVVSFHVTDTVRAWQSGGGIYGFCIKRLTEDTASQGDLRYVVFSTAEAGASGGPTLTVTYKSIKGLESYYSYTTVGGGTLGTGSINHATGLLVHAFSTVSSSDSIFGYAPTLYYLQKDAEGCYNTIGHTPTGLGMRFDWQRSIAVRNVLGAGELLCYTDGDGTEHFFTETTAGVWEDEDGLFLTVTEQYGEDGTTLLGYELTDGFSAYVFDATGRFTEMRDADGNRLVFEYGSNQMLSSVVLYPAEAEVIEEGSEEEIDAEEGQEEQEPVSIVQLTVSSNADGIYTGISCSATGISVSFTYGITYFPGGDHYVTYDSITYTREETDPLTNAPALLSSLQLSYTTNGKLLSVMDAAACRQIAYSYGRLNAESRVSQITESAFDAGTESYVDGQTMTLQYGTRRAVIQTAGSDDVYGTADDLVTHYGLDYAGRPIFAYTTDVGGTRVYGATSATYEGDIETPTNGLSTYLSTGAMTHNLLQNGNFEGIGHWNTAEPSVMPESTVFDGGRALRLSLSGTSGQFTEATYPITLEPGTYTLSAFFRVDKGDAESMHVSLGIYTSWGPYHFPNELVAEAIPLETYNIELVTENALPLSVTFTIETEATYVVRIAAESTVPAGGDQAFVYVDGAVLAENEGMSLYNYLYNGDLAQGTASWSYIPTGAAEGQTPTVAEEALVIPGSWDNFAHVEQTVTFASNPVGAQTYVLSGWAEAEHALSGDFSEFALEARVVYSDHTTAAFVFPFDHTYPDKQYVSGLFTTDPSKAVSSITVCAVYSGNYGTAYFDGLSLVRDFGTMASFYEYNDDGRLSTVTDAEGKTTTYTYAGEDDARISSVTTADGESITYDYNDTDIPTRVTGTNVDTDGDGQEDLTADYAYNALGQITGNVISGGDTGLDLRGTVTTYSGDVDGFGYVLTETDVNNHTVTYEYTGGLLTKVLDGDGQTGLSYHYDAKGNLTHVYPVSGNAEQTNSASVEYEYDTRGRLTRLITASTVCELTYDIFDRTTSIKVGGRVMATYTYRPANGKLLSVTYGNGYTMSYVYDHLGRTKSVVMTASAGGTASLSYVYSYNTEGQLVSMMDYTSSRLVVYEYTLSGQLFRQTVYGLVEDVTGDITEMFLILSHSFLYNGDGKLEKDSVFLPMQMNGDDPTETERLDRWYQTSYSYNADGLLSGGTVQNGTETVFSYSYTYDHLQRQTSATWTDRLVSMERSVVYGRYTVTEGDVTTEYTTLLPVHHRNRLTGAGNLLLEESADYVMDGEGRITSLIRFEYDEDWHLNTIVDSYVYDDLGQLVRENNARLYRTYLYSYDDAGNLTERKEYGYTTAATPSTTLYDTVIYTYGDSAWGDLLTAYDGQTITYDAIGNPLSYRGTSMTWSDGRRLAHTSKGLVSVDYTYDGDGLRTERRVNYDTVYRYVYSGGALLRIERTTEDGNTDCIDFLYDGQGAIGFVYSDSVSESQIYYFLIGYGGDIDGVMDRDGNILVRYVYDAWGNFTETFLTNDAADLAGLSLNPLRYRGYVYDAETGFYYLQSRYYDPEVGRFINADSYVSTGQGFLGNNMFSYCGNNPINRKDPSGQSFILTLLAVVVVSACTVALTSCSKEPTPPPDYVQDNSTDQNCYSYAFDLPNAANPGDYSANGDSKAMFEDKNAYTPDEIAEFVLRDMDALDKSVRIVNSPEDKRENEYIVAMKTSTYILASIGVADYHFAVLLSDGSWADKPGSTPSRWNALDGTAIAWDLSYLENYYNTETVYFAVQK